MVHGAGGGVMASTAGVALSDLPEPVAGPPLTLTGPPVPPGQRIYFYPSDEWEEFIREWAQGLGEDYVQIKQLGGGVFGGRKSSRPFDGVLPTEGSGAPGVRSEARRLTRTYARRIGEPEPARTSRASSRSG